MSTQVSSRSPSRGSRSSAKRPKSKEKKTGSANRKRKHSAKKSGSSATSTSTGPPDYIIPLVLTSKTQEIFHCRANEDLTEENPFKLVKKDEILNDLKARAAVSDFHPFKSLVVEYPGEEILLVLDGEFKYGQNFYLVSTEEAKESILHPPETATDEEEEEEDVEEYIPQHMVLKPWVTLGSELEIEEETVKQRQTKIKYMISRTHREFGAPITFSDHNASEAKDGYIECASYQDKRFSIPYKERDAGTQVVPVLQDQSTQTKWSHPRNACVQYNPRTFSEEEIKTCLSSKTFKQFINSVSSRLEMALQQNEIMNVFLDDCKALSESVSTFEGKSDSHLKEFQSFTEHHFCKDKTISCINWHPTIPGLVAVSLTERLSFEERVNASSKLLLTPSLIVIWSFADPIHPQVMLQCPDDIYCFQFCPSDPNIIAGGCINGQVVLWDISAYHEKLETTMHTSVSSAAKTGLEPKASNQPPFIRYCAVSSIEHGHKDVITDIHWLPDYFELTRTGYPYENKSGYSVQLITCSPDCSVIFWDIRSNKPHGQNVPDKKPVDQNQLENPLGTPDTFKHLDLIWKPLLKGTMPKTGTGGEYSPIKISLSDEHYHSRTIEKLQTPVKEPKSEGGIDYGKLRVSSAKNTKTLDEINTNYFAGTEDGELIYTNWKMEKDGDTGKLISARPSQTYVVHDGVVHTVQRSPFMKDIILTVGGWSLALWREGVTSGPILQSCCSQKRYTAAHWSPSRPGLFYIGREDGNVDMWDLLEKTHEASQTQNISTAMISYIKPWIVSAKQHFLAVADDHGTLHILEIPWTLHHPSANEMSSVQHYLEREVRHLKYSAQRKTQRGAAKREMDMKLISTTDEISLPVKQKQQIEEEFAKEYEVYMNMEHAILSALGLRKD
ncbi:dynein axonemal intermediate chain 3 [Pelodytes ibericus]